MSTKRVRTVSDLVRFRCGLRIDCGSCGASRTVDGYAAASLGGGGPLNALQGRLRCARCGQREAKLAVLLPPPPR